MLVSRLLLRSSFGIDGLQRVGAAEGLLEGEAFGPFSTPSAVGSAERAGRYRCGDWLHQGTVVKLGASQNGGAQCLCTWFLHLRAGGLKKNKPATRGLGPGDTSLVTGTATRLTQTGLEGRVVLLDGDHSRPKFEIARSRKILPRVFSVCIRGPGLLDERAEDLPH